MADEYLILVLGRRRMGKTTLARRLAEGWPIDRVLVHDPQAEFSEYELIPDDFESKNFRPGTLVIADEIDMVCTAHGYEAMWAHDVIHYGRHHGVSLIGCSRRPANVHKDLTALCTKVYLGRITEPRDIQYCVAAWGEKCLEAPKLPPFKFIEIEP